MRRRDKVFAVLAWGALLAGLAWAWSNNFRMALEAKPLQRGKPAPGTKTPEGGVISLPEDGEAPPPPPPTGVIGTVSDDTRASMARALEARKASKPGAPKAAPSTPPR